MTITLCNSPPFTFYLPFHTSLRADQCPIHVPTTCTLGLDPCARHSLFGRTDPYYIDNFYTPPAAFSALPQHFSSPFSVIVLSSQYLFQRGPIWVKNPRLSIYHICHIHYHHFVSRFLFIKYCSRYVMNVKLCNMINNK